MVGQSGIGSASAASAVAQRYREADSIQVQRVAAKTREFASVLPAEPSVVSTISRNTLALPPPPPARPVPEAALPARPVTRSVLASPALAKRGVAAYEAAASIGRPDTEAEEISTPSGGSLSIEC